MLLIEVALHLRREIFLDLVDVIDSPNSVHSAEQLGSVLLHAKKQILATPTWFVRQSRHRVKDGWADLARPFRFDFDSFVGLTKPLKQFLESEAHARIVANEVRGSNLVTLTDRGRCSSRMRLQTVD